MPDVSFVTALHIPSDWKGDTVDILFLPAGKSVISATRNGVPTAGIHVNVTQDVIPKFQADLAAKMAQPVKPFIDYNHEKGRIAADPLAFRWGFVTDSDGNQHEGVVLSARPTTAGKADLRDRVWRHFSPDFGIDANGNVTGLSDKVTVGALVNNPAFDRQPAINAASIAAQKQHETQMSDAVIEAMQASEFITEIEAKSPSLATIVMQRLGKQVASISAKDAEIADLKAKLQASETKVADYWIEAAKTAGAIEPKNEKKVAFWRNSILSQGEDAIEALKSEIEAKASDDPITKRITSTDGKAREASVSNGGSIEARMAEAEKDAKATLGDSATYSSIMALAADRNPELYAIEEAL